MTFRGRLGSVGRFIARTIRQKFGCTGPFTLAMTFLLTLTGIEGITLQEIRVLQLVIDSRLRVFLNSDR